MRSFSFRSHIGFPIASVLLVGACFRDPGGELGDDDETDTSATDSTTAGDSGNTTGQTTDGDTTTTTTNGDETTDGQDDDADDADDADDSNDADDSDESDPPWCGDGIVDDGEECDNGPANGVGNECTEDCVFNSCGDGVLGPDEGCDHGAGNAAEVGKCAPDCSHVITEKQIHLSVNSTSSNMGGSPVATMDSLCPNGFKALFVHGNARRATTAANAVVDPIDWVLQPYTLYVNTSNQPIWLTDDVPLLGMRDGQFMGLENSIAANGSAATGLQQNWLNNVSNTCNGWQVGTDAAGKNNGIAWLLSIGVINNGGVQPCNYPAFAYCVEQ